MNKKKIIIIIIFTIIIAGLGAYLYAPGINVYGQYYWLYNVSSFDELKEKTDRIKENYPQYKAYSIDRDTTELLSRESSFNEYLVYFHLEEQKANIIVLFDIKEKYSYNRIRLKLLRVSRSRSGSGDWKDIDSRQLSREDNGKIKSLFESEILDKLGKWERD
jgi:hypothetical protein